MKTKLLRTIYISILLVVALACAGCGKSGAGEFVPAELDMSEPTLSEEASREYQFLYPREGDLCADITVLDYGHICVRLFKDEAPYACDNFIKKAKNGEYDGTLVSTIVDGYYVQAGKPINSDVKEESIWGGGFSNEISDLLFPVRGSLCMANQGKDGTNATEFFFNVTTADTINSLEAPLKSRYGMGLRDYIRKNYDTKLTEEQLNKFLKYGGAPWEYGHNTVFGQMFKGFDVLDRISASGNDNKTIYINKVTIYEYVG